MSFNSYAECSLREEEQEAAISDELSEVDIQRSSEEGRRADALALRADERRDKLR